MNTDELVIYTPAQADPIEVAKKGLHGELTELSWLVYEQTIDDFIAYAQEHGGAEFGGNMAVAVSSYLKHLTDSGFKPSTVNAKASRLRRFFEWGVKANMIDHQMLLMIREVKAPKNRGEVYGNWIDEEGMQRLLDAPDTTTLIGRRDRALLALLLGCGLRRSEAVKLTWGNLMRQGNTWAIVNLQRKHHRTQALIAMPDWVMQVIVQYKPRGADDEHVIVSYNRHGQARESISGQAILDIVKHYADELGLGTFRPHDARRSMARAAVANGLELSQLAMTLGHESVVTTERYVRELYKLEDAANAIKLEV